MRMLVVGVEVRVGVVIIIRSEGRCLISSHPQNVDLPEKKTNLLEDLPKASVG